MVTGLPLVTKETPYDVPTRPGAGINKINGVSKQVAIEIRKLQPFNARNEGFSVEQHLLFILNELVNIDKHRMLQLTFLYPTIFGVGVSAPSPNQLEMIPHIPVTWKLEDGTILGHWKIKGVADPSKVNVTVPLIFQILFDDPTVTAVKMADVFQVIAAHHNELSGILNFFDPLLQNPIV